MMNKNEMAPMEKAAHRKVLIISYYWPPAGGPGVQRWLMFSKFLPNFGWAPIVYTPENPSYPQLDETLLAKVPQDIVIWKQPIWEPYHLAEKFSAKNRQYKGGQFEATPGTGWKNRLSVWIRGNFFIPDARRFWIRPSLRFLAKKIREEGIGAVITTGPPHSLHLIGLGLKKQFPDLPWVADFRDPWTQISYHEHLQLTPFARRRHLTLEKKVLQSADLVLATSYTDAENFRKLGAKAETITNGFAGKPVLTKVPKTEETFTISYVGILEQLRNPLAFWQALGELIAAQPSIIAPVKIRFAGTVDAAVRKAIEEYIPQQNLEYLGYLSHQESLEVMRTSDLLVLTNFPAERSAGIIPGKLFEYLASGNPLLSVGPAGADVATILEETRAGMHFLYHQKEEMKTYLRELMTKERPTERNTAAIAQFSRERLTEKLALLLDGLILQR